MKKVIPFILSIAMLLAFTACGGDSEETVVTPAPAEAAAEPADAPQPVEAPVDDPAPEVAETAEGSFALSDAMWSFTHEEFVTYVDEILTDNEHTTLSSVAPVVSDYEDVNRYTYMPCENVEVNLYVTVEEQNMAGVEINGDFSYTDSGAEFNGVLLFAVMSALEGENIDAMTPQLGLDDFAAGLYSGRGFDSDYTMEITDYGTAFTAVPYLVD